MSTHLDTLQSKLVQYLQLTPQDRSIIDKVSSTYKDLKAQQAVSQQIAQFLGFFDMFKNLKALTKELKTIITETFEICEQPTEFQEILLKSILLRFTEIYIDHAGYADKDKIIKTLSQSLEILAPQALIINLGLMVKPIFSDAKYIQEQTKEAETVMVEKVDTSAIAMKIKGQVDKWIRAQKLNLELQNQITADLATVVKKLAAEFKLPESAPEFKQILMESTEMLNMQLTAISLMLDIDDEDLSPQPINI